MLVALIFTVAGFTGPGIHIESFESVAACESYAQSAGWLMVRSTLGMNSSPDPVPGLRLQCVHRT